MRDLKTNLFPSFKKLFPIIFLLLIVGIFFYNYFLLGKIPFPGDFVVGIYKPWIGYKWDGFPYGVPVKNPILADVPSFVFPMQTLAWEIISKGLLPLWNPYILGGSPLLANFQSAAFSPFNLYYLLIEQNNAWALSIITQHFFSAFFMFLLLKHIKLNTFSSIFGSIIFAFSGYNSIWSQWSGHVGAAAFIPAILLMTIKFIETKKYLLYGSLFSILFGLQIFSGYPQTVIYQIFIIGILVFFYLLLKKINFKTTSFLFIFTIFGMLLASIQIVPGAQLLNMSQREIEPHPYEWAFLPIKKFITFFAPDYFGNHSTGNYWGPQDYTSNTGFVGVITLIFFAIAIFNSKNKYKKYFISIAIFSLLLSFPTFLSILLWKSKILGFQAASAHRALIIWCFSASVLAAMGFNEIKNNIVFKIKNIFAFIYLLFLFTSAYSVFQVFKHNQNSFNISLKNLIFPFIILFASSLIFLFRRRLKKLSILFFIALLILELLRFYQKFNVFTDKKFIFPETKELQFLIKENKPFRVISSSIIPVNLRMPYKIESFDGYDAVYPSFVAQYIKAINSGAGYNDYNQGRYALVDNEISPLLNIANVKYVISDLEKPIEKNFELEYKGKEINILKSKNYLPRAFFTQDFEVVKEDIALEILLTNKNFNKIFLLKNPNIELKKINEPSIVSYNLINENHSQIIVDSKVEGLVFVSDAWFPGWKAYVNQNETEIYRANFMFRAVKVRPGKSIIDFKYNSKIINFSLLLSISTFIMLIITLFIVLIKRIY